MGVNTEAVGGRRESALTERLVRGAIAGVAGGIVFGVLMAMMGMLPMVAGLVGSSSAVVGLIVHLVLSVIIGAGYGLVLGTLGESYVGGLWTGAVYGFVWWILGPLLIMPILMGMGPQLGMALTGPMLMSLVGHLLYGLVTGLAYAFQAERAR
ncbi:MAG TPA: hypothetical protein VGL23_24400 [Chloroflexota bacterium]|jgi:uncharacterized membrane protein YagU involved in acid resistance